MHLTCNIRLNREVAKQGTNVIVNHSYRVVVISTMKTWLFFLPLLLTAQDNVCLNCGSTIIHLYFQYIAEYKHLFLLPDQIR